MGKRIQFPVPQYAKPKPRTCTARDNGEKVIIVEERENSYLVRSLVTGRKFVVFKRSDGSLFSHS